MKIIFECDIVLT